MTSARADDVTEQDRDVGEDDEGGATGLRQRQELAEWLGRHLRARGSSQRRLAMLAGVSPSSISRLMTGQRMPNLVTIRRLADALGEPLPGVGTDWLARTSRRSTMSATRRVEEALRSDPVLTPVDVSLVMRRYLTVRAQADDPASPRDPAS